MGKVGKFIKAMAVAFFRDEMGMFPDAADLCRRGAKKHRREDFDGAIADYNRALELKPDFAIAYFFRATTNKASGKTEAALIDYDKAIALNPSFVEAYSHRGNLKRSLGDLAGALIDFAKAIELDANCASAFFVRGCLYYDQRKWKEALSDFEKKMEMPARDYAQFRIWLVRGRMGQQEAASHDLRSYLQTRATRQVDDWPVNIGLFLTGQMSEEDLFQRPKIPTPNAAGSGAVRLYFIRPRGAFSGRKSRRPWTSLKNASPQMSSISENIAAPWRN